MGGGAQTGADLMDARRIPFWPLALGLAGLIPFYLSLWMSLSGEMTLAMFGPLSFVSYAAVILSFLGGARWGLELARAPAQPAAWRLVASVAPSIAGWIAVVVNIAPTFSIAVLMAGFAAQFAWDARASRTGHAPAWYLALRAILTAGVMLALGLELARVLGLLAG
jgi:hypothetical protein